jgi:hypothetical protein
VLLLLSCPAQPSFVAKIRAAAAAAAAAAALQPSPAQLRPKIRATPAQPSFVTKIRAAAAQSSNFSKIRAEYLPNASAKEFWACRSFLRSTFRDRRRATSLLLSLERTATSTSDHCYDRDRRRAAALLVEHRADGNCEQRTPP